jgi:hypothetical protein
MRIDTASLTIPSPNIIEYNYGNSFSFTIVSAATVSVAHNTLASTRHSTVESSGIKSSYFIQMSSKEKMVIETKVPGMPSIKMFGRFLMKCLRRKV